MPSIKHLLENTSAHGFAPMVQAKHGWKALWIIAMIACWTTMTVQIAKVSLDYYRHASATTVTEKTDDSASFPAITICNQYPLRDDKVDANAALKSAVEKIETESLEEYVAYTNLNDLYFVNDYTMKSLSRFYYSAGDAATSVFHTVNDMLLSCKSLNLCDGMRNVTWKHGLYGHCFSLVTTADVFMISGPAYGLKLLLTLRNWRSVNTLSVAQGLVVMVHNVEDVPFPSDQGTFIPPGTVVNIATTKKQTKRLSVPYATRPCVYYNNQTDESFRLYKNVLVRLGDNLFETAAYDAYSCEAACFVMAVIRLKNCIMADYVTKDLVDERWPGNNFTTCDEDAITTIFDWDSENDCVCPSACDEITYNQRVAVSEFPAEDYVRGRLLYGLSYAKLSGNRTVQRLLHDAGLTLPDWAVDLFNEWDTLKVNIAPPESLVTEATKAVKKNYVLLHVFKESSHYTCTEQLAKMNFSDLLSNIGGTLGLWSGMSFLTLLEFAHFFSAWLLHCEGTRKQLVIAT